VEGAGEDRQERCRVAARRRCARRSTASIQVAVRPSSSRRVAFSLRGLAPGHEVLFGVDAIGCLETARVAGRIRPPRPRTGWGVTSGFGRVDPQFPLIAEVDRLDAWIATHVRLDARAHRARGLAALRQILAHVLEPNPSIGRR
jgi:hypothetical protein